MTPLTFPPAPPSETEPSRFHAGIQESYPLVYSIWTVTARFQTGEGEIVPGTNARVLEEDGIRFFGIHRDMQMSSIGDESDRIDSTVENYSRLNRHLLEAMSMNPDSPMIQVVGDSSPYSLEGTSMARDFLEKKLPPEAAILYGYAGLTEPDGTKCVNAAVTDFITSYERLSQAVGNLVAFQTPMTLIGWECLGPLLKCQILVYGDNETDWEHGTLFSHGITTSDYMADTLLSLEGDVRSFSQMCNFLLLNRSIFAISGLRSEEAAIGTDAAGVTKPYFSAPEFMQFLRDQFITCDCTEEIDVFFDNLYREYFETHFIADPKGRDYDADEKCLKEAWALFKRKRLYEKLDHFCCSSVKV